MPHSAPETVDILGLGVSTIDELLVLEHHPRLNEKQKILSRTRQCGGLTGSALVAAARMGCHCGYLIALGKGELSTFLRNHMAEEGVKLFEDDSNPETEPYLSMILSEMSGERSILWDNSRSRAPHIGEYERTLALSSRCLFVDHIYATAILELVKEARRAGIDVVGDFERTTPQSPELMDWTNHIILPIGYARQKFGPDVTAREAAIALAKTPGRSLACVTDGINGAWWALGDAPEVVYNQEIFPMRAIVDTTGCGDVFHGIYAAALVQGFPPAERLRRASAAAAIKTQVRGAQAGAPTADELERFLAERTG